MPRYATQPPAAAVDLIVGPRGSGKSKMAAYLSRDVRRFIAWDPLRDRRDLGAGFWTVDQLEQHKAALREGVVRVAVVQTDWDDPEREFVRFCRCVWEIGALYCEIEELSEVCGPSYMPGALRRLVKLGRHRGIALLCVGQRFAEDFPKGITSAASRIIAFRQSEPADLAALEKRCGPGTAAACASLPEFHYLDWAPGKGAVTRPPLAA